MRVITKRVLPRFHQVVHLIAQDPSREDFGFADFPTLISLLILAVPAGSGDRRRIIDFVKRFTAYDEEHIQFLLDQYQGRNARHHLWRRNSAGRYELLLK